MLRLWNRPNPRKSNASTMGVPAGEKHVKRL